MNFPFISISCHRVLFACLNGVYSALFSSAPSLCHSHSLTISCTHNSLEHNRITHIGVINRYTAELHSIWSLFLLLLQEHTIILKQSLKCEHFIQKKIDEKLERKTKSHERSEFLNFLTRPCDGCVRLGLG